MAFSDRIKEIFEQNGIGSLLDGSTCLRFERLYELLVDTNKEYNLTAITDEDEVITKHFADCAKICDLIPEESSVIDVGCGAGFPTLPLAILRQDCTFTAIDSTGKKIEFVKKAATELGLENVTAINARAEDLAKEQRESFDVATSRAVAALNVLDELCLPFVKIGGRFIAMKGSKVDEEIAQASRGIKILGGKIVEIQRSELKGNGASGERAAVLIEKVSKTPVDYPRQYSRICKKPL